MHECESSCKLLASDATTSAEKVSRLQDRFTSLVPALTKYGATTVGVTLLVIGLAGLYETLTEGAEVADQAQPALAGEFYPETMCHLPRQPLTGAGWCLWPPVVSQCIRFWLTPTLTLACMGLPEQVQGCESPGLCEGHMQALVCPTRQRECPSAAAAWLQQSPE